MARRDIVRLARDLRGRARLVRLPIDSEAACRCAGVSVERWPLGPHLREMVGEDGIAISAAVQDSAWVRFLVAHALGHVLLHAGSTELYQHWPTGNVVIRQREAQANIFARALLIPGSAWLEHAPTQTDPEMATLFGVPQEHVRAYRSDLLAGNYDPRELPFLVPAPALARRLSR